MKDLLKPYVDNRKTLLITFEIFWIAVFLLEKIGAGAGGEVARFVYVNF